MSKILVLKNDRVGDLANSLKGINSLLNEKNEKEITESYNELKKMLFKFKEDHLPLSK